MEQQDEITRITVNGTSIGIQGLKTVIADIAETFKEKTDAEIIEELLKRLSANNYIPASAKEKYGKALLKEFHIYTGKVTEQDKNNGLKIKVLGPGCPQCDQLEMELYSIMSDEGISAALEHIRDIKEIGRYGVMGTPALVINEKVKAVGSVPPRYKIIEWLKEI